MRVMIHSVTARANSNTQLPSHYAEVIFVRVGDRDSSHGFPVRLALEAGRKLGNKVGANIDIDIDAHINATVERIS